MALERLGSLDGSAYLSGSLTIPRRHRRSRAAGIAAYDAPMHSRRQALIGVVSVALVACQAAPPESAPSTTEPRGPGSSATAISTPSASASPTPFREPDAVSAGLFAEVVTTDLVRRSAPRISDDSVIMGEFNLPTQLYVVGGPVVSDGYRWFLVNDMETWTGGWVAEAGKDGEVWLRPLGYEAGEWTVAGSIAVSGSANVRGATAGSDGTIYVFGGLTGGFGEEPASGAAWAFDPDAGAWRELSPMLTPRDSAQVALANDGRLYVIGGAAGGEAVSTVEVYDPASDSWDTAPPAPVLLAWGSAVVAAPDGRVLLFRHSEAWSYNPQNGQAGRIGQYDGGPSDAVVTAASEIYVLPESGGVLGSAGGPRRFDPIAGTLGQPSDARIDRGHATAAVLPDGRILVVGGRAAGGPCCLIPEPDPADPVIEVPPGAVLPLPAEAFDVTNGSWSALAPLPAGFGDFIGAVVSDDGVFVVGQRDNQLMILELAAR